ncbi:hypothetical protein [Salipiger sp. PrR003]|uniref:hypothetical protein n=1 Tax=Salipiger sp. PrR003 TaxID=2706776 RepID=UPI001F4014E4|nr:hypothetical protein [Salipiger sp. PrR003]
MKIIRAIVSGERDPDRPAGDRDVRCKSSPEPIRAALIGNDRAEHVFALAQPLETSTKARSRGATAGWNPLPKPAIGGRQLNAAAFDVRAALHYVLGPALRPIHGLGPSLALKLVAECGADLRT